MGQFNFTGIKEPSKACLGNTPRVWGSSVLARNDSCVGLTYVEGCMCEVQCLDVAL